MLTFRSFYDVIIFLMAFYIILKQFGKTRKIWFIVNLGCYQVTHNDQRYWIPKISTITITIILLLLLLLLLYIHSTIYHLSLLLSVKARSGPPASLPQRQETGMTSSVEGHLIRSGYIPLIEAFSNKLFQVTIHWNTYMSHDNSKNGEKCFH